MVILLAFIPFFTWALGDVFGTLASRKIGNIPVNFGFLLLSFLLISLFIPFAGPISSWLYIFIALLLGGVHVVGLLTYFKALEIGNASLVGAIVGSFSLVIVLLSLVIFHESLTFLQAFGILVSLTGLLLTSFRFADLKTMNLKKLFTDPGVGLALVTFFAWGVYFTLIRIPVEAIGWFWSLYPATFYFLPLFLLRSVRLKLAHIRLDRQTLGQVLAMAILGRTGDFGYNLALTQGYSSIVGAVAGTSPVLFVILARILFKEKLTNQQKAGIIITLSGIIFISIASL